MPKNLLLKVHPPLRSATRIIAIADKGLLGKRFETGDLVLDLKTYRRFYEGELSQDAAVVSALQGAENVNAVGERSVELACKALGIPKASARRIGGVPHLQIYKV